METENGKGNGDEMENENGDEDEGGDEDGDGDRDGDDLDQESPFCRWLQYRCGGIILPVTQHQAPVALCQALGPTQGCKRGSPGWP